MMQGVVAASEAMNTLDDLTEKQRAVLDLLLQHKTSKEISRLLGISPHTVDQRILLARAKFNVATRADVANEYRRLLSLYGQPIYPSSYLAPAAFDADNEPREDVGDRGGVSIAPQSDRPVPQGKEDREQALEQAYHHVLPEMFDGPYGTLLRLGYIAVIAMILIMVVLGGLSMFAQLSSLVDI
jgi:DNA-binding CsgD family transcriptional regulator